MGVFTGVSAVLQGAGAYMQVRDAQAQAAYQKAQVKSQQALAGQNLVSRSEDRARQLKATLSAIRARGGSAGVDPNTGSYATLLESTSVDSARGGTSDITAYKAGTVQAKNSVNMYNYQASAAPYTYGVSAAANVASNLLRWNSLGSTT